MATPRTAPGLCPRDRRARPLAWFLFLAAAATFVAELAPLLRPEQQPSSLDAAFVGSMHRLQGIPTRSVQSIRRAEEEGEEEVDPNQPYRLPKEGYGVDLDGDNLDNLEEFYQEGITGPKATGGPPQSFIRDLILRSYVGGGVHGARDRNYSGGWGIPLKQDYDEAFGILKKAVAEGQQGFKKDDESEWIWLCCRQNPGGLWLSANRAVPWGYRPLALIKRGKEDEFWNNVDWDRVFVRLHKAELWGGKKHIKFPYPMNPDYEKPLVEAE